MNVEDWYTLGLIGLISLLSRESQESFPEPHYEGISSSIFSLFNCPALIAVHDYWKNHSFDCTDLCWQSNVSVFQYAVKVCHSFSFKEKVPFNFMAVVTICSDFGSLKNKVCHCFHCFPIYLPWSDGIGCHDINFFFLMLSFKPVFSLLKGSQISFWSILSFVLHVNRSD